MNCETFTGTLELLLRGDCDRCAQKLPNILSNIFGVPIPELNDDFCMRPDDLPLPSRALILQNFQPSHAELLKLIYPQTKEGNRGSEESLNLFDTVRKINSRHHDFEYKFPRVYAPSSLQDKTCENTTLESSNKNKMMNCSALELLVYSMSALPLIHSEETTDTQMTCYLDLVRSFVEYVFGVDRSTSNGVRKQAGEPQYSDRSGIGRPVSEEEKFSYQEKDRIIQIMTSFWLNPSVCFKALYFRTRPMPFDRGDSIESLVAHNESQSSDLGKSRLRLNRRIAQSAEALSSRLAGQDPASMLQSWTELAYLRIYGFLRWALAETCVEWKARPTEKDSSDVDEFQVYVRIWRHITSPIFWEDESADGCYKDNYVLNNFPFYTVVLIDILRALRTMAQEIVSPALVDSVVDTLCTVLDSILGPAAESRGVALLRSWLRGWRWPSRALSARAQSWEFLVNIGPDIRGLQWIAAAARTLLVVRPPADFRRKWELALLARARVAEGGAGAAPAEQLRRWLAGAFDTLHPAEALPRLQDGVGGGGGGAPPTPTHGERRALEQELNEFFMLDDYVLVAPASAAAGGGPGWGAEMELQWVPALRRLQAPQASRFLSPPARAESPPPRVQWEQLYQVSPLFPPPHPPPPQPQPGSHRAADVVICPTASEPQAWILI